MKTQKPASDTGKPTPPHSPGRSFSRRDFVALGLAAPLIIPRHVLGRTPARLAPSDTLTIAGVGVGGMGQNYLAGCEHESIVALVDVDDQYAAPVFRKYPSAKTYRDYRVMLERENQVDAVVIGTPDHSHAVIAFAAIELGKHVYVAKPMTRTIHEARAITQAATRAGVATQMSVQSCASDEAVTTAEWLMAGAVGQVREVHVWSDRPVWPQGIPRPKETPPVPPHLDWDLWLGPAPQRPYHPSYHPFDFRGWYDFGTGALGDMACHAFHVFFDVLEIARPASVSASVTVARIPAFDGSADPSWTRSKPVERSETFPPSSIVIWEYPARGALPPLRMYWYDGGLRPPVPAGLPVGVTIRGDGIIFVGDDGALLSGFTGGPIALSEERTTSFQPPAPSLPRSIGHYREWTEACKGGPAARCAFGFAQQVTEVALLGVVAQRTGAYLEWDADAMRFTNNEAANEFLNPPDREGW
jgi:predicted dehydrogenase